MTSMPESQPTKRRRHRRRSRDEQPERVAVISVHTSPTEQPGAGDSGGLNVYVLSVAKRLAEQGIEVDIFTRRTASTDPDIQEIAPRSRLIQVTAGPRSPVPKEDLPALLPRLAGGVVRAAADHADTLPHRHSPYDVVHSHYWLSGWVGSRAKEVWGVPHVASFHTLGKVKNEVLPPGDSPEPRTRLTGEQRIVRAADRILSPTTTEADELVTLYGADPGRIRVVAPGVDRSLFVPHPRSKARESLRLGGARLILFVGRLQPFKGPDVAIRALAEAVRSNRELTSDLILVVVGGPAGLSGVDRVSELMELAASAGVGDRVLFLPPQPHERLADFYSAAEAVLVPSRSESFGLVALEAQACGTPVIASASGGLRHAVVDGESGFLIEGNDPGAYAERVLLLLADPDLAARLSMGALRQSSRFSWDRTASDLHDVYREVVHTATR